MPHPQALYRSAFLKHKAQLKGQESEMGVLFSGIRKSGVGMQLRNELTHASEKGAGKDASA